MSLDFFLNKKCARHRVERPANVYDGEYRSIVRFESINTFEYYLCCCREKCDGGLVSSDHALGMIKYRTLTWLVCTSVS